MFKNRRGSCQCGAPANVRDYRISIETFLQRNNIDIMITSKATGIESCPEDPVPRSLQYRLHGRRPVLRPEIDIFGKL